MIYPVRIGDKYIGLKNPCFIIAEAGVNHNGNMDLAHRLIDEAIAAGADAIKFQSFIADELVIPNTPKAKYQLETTGFAGSQYEMLKSLELSEDQQLELKKYCEKVGILYLCTPYENISIDFLDRIHVAAYKIASTDITNDPFLYHIGNKGRPVLLSTGMSTLGEVEHAVHILRMKGLNGKIIILHCTSEYPAPLNEINLRAMLTMRHAFGCPVGFSDHTSGIGASPWAVALGACVIEKHFTLDRKLPGPDHQASVIPSELRELVKTIRAVETSLGDGIKLPMPSEIQNKTIMQKSLVARRLIKAGQIICPEDLTCKRPGTGLSPIWFDRIMERQAKRDILSGNLIELNDIDWSNC